MGKRHVRAPGPRLPISAGCLPVAPHDRAADADVPEIELSGQPPENTAGNAALHPAPEPSGDAVPLSEAFRKVAPPGPRPGAPWNRLREKTAVRRRHSQVTLSARKDVLYPFPHVIRQDLPAFAHHTAPVA